MSTVKIGNKLIGDDCPCFIVAEIGINHNGDLRIAKQLIDAAVDAGCDAVKFQKRTVEIVYTPNELARFRESPFGTTNGDLKRGLEFGQKEYKLIADYCKDANIIWFASCWDGPSIDLIDQFNPPCYKIASASLTDADLLRHFRNKSKPLILSTGMSSLEQVRGAVRILDDHDLILLHCVATYPTADHELNLRVINTLQEEFPKVPIGYSGHGHGTTMSVCAVSLGACLVERHITLDRTMWGSDHSASLEPAGLKHMVKNIRRFEVARGNGVKKVLDSEIPIMEKLRRKSDF